MTKSSKKYDKQNKCNISENKKEYRKQPRKYYVAKII